MCISYLVYIMKHVLDRFWLQFRTSV